LIKIKSLIISNIGRFVGDHTVDIDSLDSLFQVDGKNDNTGGSSGSGKTTIFNSLDYLLGVNDIPTTVLQSRLTKNPMAVEGLIEKDNELYTIKRSKSGGLSIKTPTGEVSGSSKVTEEWLQKFIGIPTELLRPAYHKRQKEGGFFLNKTGKEMYEFLSTCLDLGHLTKKQEKADLKAKELEPQIFILKEKIKTLQSYILTITETKKTISEPKCEVDEEVLSRCADNASAALKDLVSIEKELEVELQIPAPVKPQNPEKPERLKEIDALVSKERAEKASVVASVDFKIQGMKQEIRKTQALIQSLRIKESSIPALDEKLSELKAQIEKAKTGKCPTCDQDWHNEHSEAKYQDMISKAKSVFTAKQEAIGAAGLISGHEEELKKFQLSLAEAEQEMLLLKEAKSESSLLEEKATLEAEHNSKTLHVSEKYSQDLKKHSETISNIKERYSPQIAQASGQYQMLRDVYNKVSTVLESHKREMDSYTKNVKNITDQEAKGAQEIEAASKTLSVLEKDLSLASNASRLIKSYVGQLFFDSLTQIANKATATLMQIPNMETACITFDTFKETKSGSIKEEVSANISMDGEGVVPVKSLSGGERATIDLAVDLAVIDMIEERTGKGLNLFILDEPFDGLDSVCKERCLSVLINHDTNKKIGLVDHSNETKELVSSRITAVRSGQESRIL